MSKKTYIFILYHEIEGIMIAMRQKDADEFFKSWEQYAINKPQAADAELPFKVIAKIAEPVTLDFNTYNIEWYEEDPEREKAFIDRAALAIANFIQYGQQ